MTPTSRRYHFHSHVRAWVRWWKVLATWHTHTFLAEVQRDKAGPFRFSFHVTNKCLFPSRLRNMFLLLLVVFFFLFGNSFCAAFLQWFHCSRWSPTIVAKLLSDVSKHEAAVMCLLAKICALGKNYSCRELRPRALWQPRGVAWRWEVGGGRWEGGSRARGRMPTSGWFILMNRRDQYSVVKQEASNEKYIN